MNLLGPVHPLPAEHEKCQEDIERLKEEMATLQARIDRALKVNEIKRQRWR